MPKLSKRLTDSTARSTPLPKAGEILYWCAHTPGFGLRVSSSGVRAYICERRVNGKTTRRTLGKASGSGAISSDAARALQLVVSSELQQGVDRVLVRRAERSAEVKDSITLADAIKAYVKGKRRGKDGYGLKERTKADYLAMVTPGGTKSTGKPFAGGMLCGLAAKSIYKITADDMRRVYDEMLPRSQRQATYAMQVLRAVLNWHGAKVDNSPLSKATAGKDRIVLPPTAGKPRPIPPEKLSGWWGAASSRLGSAAADGCRFILLTGCRPGEVFGSTFEPGLLVRDVDLAGRRVTLLDTKNRKSHTIMLSTHAAAVLAPYVADKAPAAKVFDVIDPGKTLTAINKEAGVVGITPHKLRHTFASVAEELVSGYALKRMLNHADNGDVTGGHYVGKSEAQLREAWQTVAEFIAKA